MEITPDLQVEHLGYKFWVGRKQPVFWVLAQPRAPGSYPEKGDGLPPSGSATPFSATEGVGNILSPSFPPEGAESQCLSLHHHVLPGHDAPWEGARKRGVQALSSGASSSLRRREAAHIVGLGMSPVLGTDPSSPGRCTGSYEEEPCPGAERLSAAPSIPPGWAPL